MKKHKKLLSLVLAFMLALCVSIPAFAAVEDTGFSDVDAGAWYAEAVMYCREHGLITGIGNNQFAPEVGLTRAQLATVLYRIEGAPAVTGTDTFTDTADNLWYSDAVLWISQQKIMEGYGGGRFGPKDPVTREQMTTILYRYAGEPAVSGTAGYQDASSISAFAVSAVTWAEANSIVRPVSGMTFAPKENATRAQVAAALMNYDRMTQPASDARILIAYFSVPETSGVDAVAQASRVVENGEVVGNVEFIAGTIQEETGGDIFAIETVQTYPGEHQALLDFAAAEMAANARPELSTSISNLNDYDVIFIGYPIWWDEAPAMIASFLAENDFSGKIIAPFCTSSYSPIDNSLHIFRELASGAAVADGLTANSESAIRPWAEQVMSRAEQ